MGIPALRFTLLTTPRQLLTSTELSPALQHFASRQAPPLPRRLRAEPKINGRLSDARLDKPRFALKAQFCRKLCLRHYLGLRISARQAFLPLLPWLVPSCENATLQQRQQARERTAQLAAATSKQSAPQAAQLSFPFMLDFGASRPVCKRAPRAGVRLVILSRMVTPSPRCPRPPKCACVALQVKSSLVVYDLTLVQCSVFSSICFVPFFHYRNLANHWFEQLSTVEHLSECLLLPRSQGNPQHDTK